MGLVFYPGEQSNAQSLPGMAAGDHQPVDVGGGRVLLLPDLLVGPQQAQPRYDMFTRPDE